MAKDPAFLFYPSDFLTGTMFLTNEQIGIYVRLLCSQHQHGGLIDKDSFNGMVGNNLLLRNKFIETDNGFYNERLMVEMDKRNKKSNNISQAVKEVWEKRKMESHQKAMQSHNNPITIPSNIDAIPMGTVNRNEDININNKSVIEIWFEDLPNSTHLELICRNTGLTLDFVKSQIVKFKPHSELSYPTQDKFISHFKNWLLKNKTQQSKEFKPLPKELK